MGKAFIIHNISFLLNNLGTVTFITDNQKEDLGDALMFSAYTLYSDVTGTCKGS